MIKKDVPKEVLFAIKLLLIGFFIGLIIEIPYLLELFSESCFLNTCSFEPILLFEFVLTIFLTLIHLLLIVLIFKRKNFARIILLLLIVISLPFIIIELPLFFENVFELLLLVLQIALEITGIVILFQKKSSKWFNY